MIQTSPRNQRTIIFILGLLTAIGPLSIDMYLSAFPAIAESLHTDISKVTLSLSFFFVGISAGQLLYGPLLERYGRKRPLYGGLFLYFLGALGCATAENVELLIASRLLQGLGSSVGMVAARAMVRDLFEVKDSARVFSMLMLVVSVSPIIAPSFGGIITTLLGWRAIFGVLIIIILLILLGSWFFLPESKAPDPTFSLAPKHILQSFASVLKHPGFLTHALTGAVSSAGLYAYIAGSPHVFIDLYKVTETQFGWIFAAIAAGLVTASQLNTLVLKKRSSQKIIQRATLLQTVFGIILVLIVAFGWDSVLLTMACIFAFLGCQGFIFPNATALALAPMGHNAGNASAMIGAIQMTIGASASALVGIIHNNTPLPMSVVMTGCAITAFVVQGISRKDWGFNLHKFITR